MADKADKKPKREPLLKLERSDKRVNALALVKARAATRTRSRIKQELEAKEMKRLELKLAKGEVTAEELDDIARKED